jgi:UDP-glucose 4-epimerase
MKCVVIGGGGFIGSHLCEALLASGHEVRVFDRPEARFLAEVERAGASVYTGNFLNQADIQKVLINSEVVYHLVSATVPQTSNDNPILDVEANILGTLRLLDAAKDAQVKKIVFASSGGTVYGIPKELPIKESHPTDPTSSYGITKLTIEKYLYLYSTLYGLNYCILRIANAYGERQPVTGTQGVIGAFLDKALHNSEITVWGDGSIMRDYTYIGDIVRAFIEAGTYDGEPRIFNIGAGQGHSLNDIINIIEQVIRRPLAINNMPGRVFDIPVNVLDISRAKKYLKWQPTVVILEGISRAYKWMAKEKEKEK